MRKEEKVQIIENIAAQLESTPNFYITDIEGLNAEKTSKLRRACFEKQIKLVVVKNSLFYKALEQRQVADLAQFESVLKGSTAIMYCETPNAPAKLIKEFGAENLETLVNIKSREELIGDIVALLQSPMKNVISALTSQGGGKIAGIVKTLSEKE